MSEFLVQAERRWAALKTGRQIGALALVALGVAAFVLELVG